MVLFVMGFVLLSVWAVVADALGPIILHGTGGASIGCLSLACVFLLQASHNCKSQRKMADLPEPGRC